MTQEGLQMFEWLISFTLRELAEQCLEDTFKKLQNHGSSTTELVRHLEDFGYHALTFSSFDTNFGDLAGLLYHLSSSNLIKCTSKFLNHFAINFWEREMIREKRRSNSSKKTYRQMFKKTYAVLFSSIVIAYRACSSLVSKNYETKVDKKILSSPHNCNGFLYITFFCQTLLLELMEKVSVSCIKQSLVLYHVKLLFHLFSWNLSTAIFAEIVVSLAQLNF